MSSVVTKQYVDYPGYIFAAFVAQGGLMGFIKKRSIASLIAGLTSGSALAYGAYLNTLNPNDVKVSIVTTLLLLVIMGRKYVRSRKIMPAGMDAVVNFRISHPDAIPKSLARRLHSLPSTSTLPESLQEEVRKISSSSRHKELGEIEVRRYASSIKRLSRARAVADIQEKVYEDQRQTVLAEIEIEEEALKQERALLAEQEGYNDSHGKVAAKLRELTSRPKQRAELDRLIANVSSEIDAQKAKKAEYLAEALARREALTKLTEALNSIVQYARVDPERNVSELPSKEKEIVAKVAGVSRANSPQLGLTLGAITKAKNTPTGSVDGDHAAEKRLDPKAAVFTPTISVQPPPIQRSNTATSSHARSTLPVNPGLPTRPSGSYKDVNVPKPIASGARNGAMTMASSAPVSRSGTPLGRDRERSAAPPSGKGNSRAVDKNGRSGGVAAAGGPNRATLDVTSLSSTASAVPQTRKAGQGGRREEGEMSDKEDGELSSIGAGHRQGLKRTRGQQGKEADVEAKRRRTDAN